ncbi:BUD32 [Sanghuangporus weigelae]
MASPTLNLLESPLTQLVKQGAEAKIYKTVLHPPPSSSEGSSDAPEPILLKHRFKKNYRHPSLNSTLTKARVGGEARALMRCLRSGVRVPGIRMVDAPEGVIGIEWIEGKSVRVLLGTEEDSDTTPDAESSGVLEEEDSVVDHLVPFGLDQSELMRLIGVEIARMHKVDVIHGDLTTSNMMLRKRPQHLIPPDRSKSSAEIVLIDFGLSFISTLVEDKAVDLYVLERAFASTHPDSEPLFKLVLKTYATESEESWASVSKKLNEVRLRGRKRSMIG